MHRRSRLHTGLFVAIGLGATGLAVLCFALHVFQRLELTSVDTRFTIRGGQPTPQDVAVVGIDDVTFNELDRRFPEFTRGMYGSVIDTLHAAGAKVIALDVQFTEPTKPPPYVRSRSPLYPPLVNLAHGQDNALGYAALRAHPVVFADTEPDPKTGATKIFGGNLAALKGVAGYSAFPPDTDGVLRHMQFETDKLRSFAIRAAELYVGHAITRSDMHRDPAWIDYAGPPRTVPFVSFSHVLRRTFDRSLVRGKVVVVGSTAPSLQDVHATSTSGGGVESGPEVQASAIDTAIRGFPLQDAPTWLNILAICLLASIPPFLGLRLSATWTIVGAITLGILFAGGAQLAFDHGRVLAFVYPIGALVLAAVGTLVAHYVLAAFDRQRTRNTFARFVPEQVVNQVLAQGAEITLGGVRVVGTCMFTDLRDSTKFAEALPPETVVDVINRYLGELSEAILGNGGTLMSYLGDGFMAVFGAPLEQDDHADRALTAAREILHDRLPRFNEWFRSQGYGDEVRIGIGINTGPFLAGNVGSETRLEYTAMGDTINTASRLEAATKTSDFYMLMAESTRDALADPADDLVQVGEVDIRGRQDRITIWSFEAARKPAEVAVR